MDAAALRTGPFPNGQRQGFEFVSTPGTPLAARIEPISHHHQPAPHRRLVFQLAAELEEAHVGNGTGQMAVLHHATHVQILDTLSAALHNKPTCRFFKLAGHFEKVAGYGFQLA